MAYHFNVGTAPATAAANIYVLIATLMAAGWTKIADSDGTTYSAAGTQVTSGGIGANGLGNNFAWVRMQAPAVSGQKREFTFQANNGDKRSWRIKYSAAAGFGGGAPSATATPSATDEQIMTGAGTDAAPTFTNFLDSDLGAIRVNCACGGAPEFYSFYMFTTLSGSTTLGGGMCLDVMAAGSFPASDPDPAVVYVASPSFIGNAFANSNFIGRTAGNAIVDGTAPMQSRAWLGATNVATNFRGVALQAYGNALGGANGTGSNPFTGNDDLLPSWWMRAGGSTAPTGLKGCSTLFLTGSVPRLNLDTADVASAGAKDWVFVGAGATTAYWLPWNGTVPIV